MYFKIKFTHFFCICILVPLKFFFKIIFLLLNRIPIKINPTGLFFVYPPGPAIPVVDKHNFVLFFLYNPSIISSAT